MKLLWGDIHNHCAITYGLGSLDNALEVARRHLDFVSVTPHAFWPDIPPREPRTEFLVDFHEEGFAKIARNWKAVRQAIDDADNPGAFSTLFSFEMHSSRYGDHHFVSPDSTLEIARRDTPREVILANAARAIAVPHHIGYTPGYRGIDWEAFDEKITPVVEVVSKHGCAMHENSGFPYYHDMGPLDSRNTAFSGLRQGKRFGFVGSTDHHAGFPGSFGDGKVAVLARANTREDIFDALKRRNCYAVTGSRIRCSFSLNDAIMGEEIAARDSYDLAYAVEASAAIDRVVIFRNLEPMHIVDGWKLPARGGRYKLRLELGWGDNGEESYPWHVRLRVDGGRLCGSEIGVRGRSVISPTQRMQGGEEINRPRFTPVEMEGQEAHFFCETFRNNSTLSPSTALMICEVEGMPSTRVLYEINGRRIEATIAQLLQNGLSEQVMPYNSQAFKIHTAVPCGKYAIEGALHFPDDGAGFYHMEVRQFDGDAAYVSPIFIKR